MDSEELNDLRLHIKESRAENFERFKKERAKKEDVGTTRFSSIEI